MSNEHGLRRGMTAVVLLIVACSADEPDAADDGMADASSASGATGDGTSAGTSSTGGNSGADEASDSGPATSGTTGTDGGVDEGTGTDTGSSGVFCPDGETWDALFENVEVPAQSDTYMCRGFTLAPGGLRHAISFTAEIDDAAHVHHMILYKTATPFPEEYQSCFHGADWTFQYGWAPGVEQFDVPDEAGFLVGDQAGGETHYVLEIHYNNPLEEMGATDSSGVRLCLTEALRPENASVLAVGKVPGISIPPGEPAWEETAICPASVTSFAITEPLQVFGSFLHAHLLGRQIWTEHWRSGQKIGELGRDDMYDFNDQKILPIDGEVQGGDELVTTCIYDSTDKTETTVGGPGTDDEMCLNFLFYYPAIDYPACYVPG